MTLEAGEPSLDGKRNPAVTEAQLQAGELRRLVDGGVGQPPPAAGAPEPRDLAERVAKAGLAQSRARRGRFAHVRTVGGHAGVEEATERARDRVGVRVADRGAWLVHDLEAGEQDPPRPLLILAHDHVGGERIPLQHRPRHRGVHVREERRLEAEPVGVDEALRARLGAVQEVEEVALRRDRLLVRELTPVDAGDLGAFAERGDEGCEPGLVRGVGVLRREDEDVAAGALGAEIARASVAELLGPDLVNLCSEPARSLGAAVGGAGVDHDDLDLFVDLLARDCLQAADEIEASVLDRDDDGDHRTGAAATTNW